MSNNVPKRSRRWLAPTFFVVAVGLVGCQSGPRVDQRQLDYAQALTQSTQAIQAADLDAAKRLVDRAQQLAADDTQRSKAQSLGHLIDGVEAYAQGDVSAAKAAWGQIADPTLYREVSVKAKELGVKLAPRHHASSDASPGDSTRIADRRTSSQGVER